jgi:hypothetical protein
MDEKQRKWALIALAAIIAVCAVVRAWFGARGISIGLWGVEVCDHGCHGVRWDNVPGAQDDHYLAGYLAVAAALVGAGATVWFALGNPAAASFARITLTIAFVAMAYFIVRAFADGLNGVDIGWALVVGPVATIAARQLISPTRR